MKHTYIFAALLLGTFALAGCNNEELIPSTPHSESDTPGDSVSLIADLNVPGTRTWHNDVTEEGIKVNWTSGDKLAIYPLDGENQVVSNGSATFTIKDPIRGESSGKFKGPAAPAKGEKYLIISSPGLDSQVDNSYQTTGSYTFLLGDQMQTNNNSTRHLFDHDILLGHMTTEHSYGNISFATDKDHPNSGHQCAVMTFDLKNIPEDLGKPRFLKMSTTGGKKCFYDKIQISGGKSPEYVSPTSGISLGLNNIIADQQCITAYLMMVPTTIPEGESITITLEGSKNVYVFTSEPISGGGKMYEAGKRYTASAGKWVLDEIIYDGTAMESPEFKGGGEERSPYYISSASDLKKLITEVNNGKDFSGVYFMLGRGIHITMNDWEPIGKTDAPFKGTFVGNGNIIRGKMENNTSPNVGLFGSIESATIRDLIVAANVTSTYTDGNVGAVAGESKNSTITGCINTGTVSGVANAGGLLGSSDGSNIISCFNTGSVANAKNIGGIVGWVQTNGGTITGCFNTGLIAKSSNTTFGTIVGYDQGATNTALSHCQYMYASSQADDPKACGGVEDTAFTEVARCANLTALNGTGVTVLNTGIQAWITANSNNGRARLFMGGDSKTPPFFLSRNGGSVGGIGDAGSGWSN